MERAVKPAIEDKTEKTDRPKGVARLMSACRGPKALPALGGLSFLESSVLPVPIDVAMVPICLARPKQTWLIILIGAMASVLGAIAGYLIGAFMMGTVGDWLLGLYGMHESYAKFEAMYADQGWIAVVIAGITPIPFKAAAIVSGAAGMRLDVFILAAFGVRFLRFAMIAFTIRLFGAGFQRILDNHSWKFTALVTVGTLAGFALIPLLM
jgi:membrane protein YqaA with SNARE-associated domain